MKAVTNAGPLIALGKLGLVQLLSQMYDPILVPAPVYQEVVTRGLELGQPDAYAVQMAVARHELVVVGIEIAEASTIATTSGSATPWRAAYGMPGDKKRPTASDPVQHPPRKPDLAPRVFLEHRIPILLRPPTRPFLTIHVPQHSCTHPEPLFPDCHSGGHL